MRKRQDTHTIANSDDLIWEIQRAIDIYEIRHPSLGVGMIKQALERLLKSLKPTPTANST